MPIYWTAASIPGFENLSRSERRKAYRLALRHVPRSRRVVLTALLYFGYAFIGAQLALAMHLGVVGGALLIASCTGVGAAIYTHVITRNALPFIPGSIAALRKD